jgi:hypothetical protein
MARGQSSYFYHVLANLLKYALLFSPWTPPKISKKVFLSTHKMLRHLHPDSFEDAFTRA